MIFLMPNRPEFIQPQIRVAALNLNGPPICIYEDAKRTADELAAHSKQGSEKYSEFASFFERIGKAGPLIRLRPAKSAHHRCAGCRCRHDRTTARGRQLSCRVGGGRGRRHAGGLRRIRQRPVRAARSGRGRRLQLPLYRHTGLGPNQVVAAKRHRCPFCAERIRVEATVCPRCGRELPSPDTAGP